MQPAAFDTRRFVLGLGVATCLGCQLPEGLRSGSGSGDDDDGDAQAESPSPPSSPSEPRAAPPFPEPAPIPTDTIEALDLVYTPEPVGPGYRRVSARMGETLDSGKWLGLGYGGSQFFGPEHVIVNHFGARPTKGGAGELLESRLVNVRTGEVVLSMAGGRYLANRSGLGVVFVDGDTRPYLLDAERESLALALPEGEHGYAYLENYWIQLHPTRKQVWITARDEDGQFHLYLWPDHGEPPALPAAPFPFEIDTDGSNWDWVHPDNGEILAEVRPNFGRDEDCAQASLTREGYRCIARPGTLLSAGWRHTRGYKSVFNEALGRNIDLESVCDTSGGAHVQGRTLSASPPRLQLRCSNEFDFLAVWSPEWVRRAPASLFEAERVPSVLFDQTGGTETYYLRPPELPGREAEFDAKERRSRLVGADYDCASVRYLGFNPAYGIVCEAATGRPRWYDFVDIDKEIRARFKGRSALVGVTGLAVVLVHQGGKDRVVKLSIEG